MHERFVPCREYWLALLVSFGRWDIVHIHYLDDSCLKAIGMVTWCEFQICCACLGFLHLIVVYILEVSSSPKREALDVIHAGTFLTMTTVSLWWYADRMPVILRDEAAINSWFNDELSGDAIQKLTQPYESPDLVSKQSCRWLLGEGYESAVTYIYILIFDLPLFYLFKVPHNWLMNASDPRCYCKVLQIWYPVTPAMGRPAFNGPECVEEVLIVLDFGLCRWSSEFRRFHRLLLLTSYRPVRSHHQPGDFNKLSVLHKLGILHHQ